MPEFKLLLDDEEVKALKHLAVERGVRPQVIARDAFRAGMEYPKQVTPALVPSSGSPTTTPVIDSGLAQALKTVRELLSQAVGELDGVLTDGQSLADQIGAIERAIETGEDLGDGGEDPPSDRLTKTKGRRAR